MKTNKKINTVLYHVFVNLLGLIMIYPIIWMVASSLKESTQVMKDPTRLIGEKLMFSNYIEGWKGVAGISFTTFFSNSFIYSIFGTIAAVCSSALVAYGFSRFKFKGKKIFFGCMMLTMMLPTQVIMIPQFAIFHNLGWINSFKPLLIPTLFGQPFFIFMIIQFISGIPGDLDEAAKIDGCSKYGIFFKIILPLIVPAIITCGIFSFYWKWDDFMGPLLYLNKPQNFTVSLALKMFADPEGLSKWGPMFAMATLSLMPIFIIFVTCQKYLVEGISTTGLKG